MALGEQPFFRKLLSLPDARLRSEIIEQIEIELKYAGYIGRQKDEIEKMERFEAYSIPESFHYDKVKSFQRKKGKTQESSSPIHRSGIPYQRRHARGYFGVDGVSPKLISIL